MNTRLLPNFALAFTVLTISLASSFAYSQTNIDSINKYSCQENCGWMNWRDSGSPSGTRGAHIAGTFLSGMVWNENIGFLDLGDGTPANNSNYANLDGVDAGVNILGGLAWGENIGWVNLDDAVHFVGIRCPADFNDDGAIDFFDYLDFVDDFSANLTTADFNLDGSIDFFDYLDFVDAFSIGC